MAVVITWTKTPKWSSSDDGTVLGGADLGNLQTDIEGHSHSGIATLLTELNDIALTSVAQGNILYRGTTYWNNLAAGTAGDILKSGGTGANPSWLTTLPTANGGTGATANANAASGVVVLDASSKLPAVDGSQLTGIAGPTQVNDVDAGTAFDNNPEVTFLTVDKTITSGDTVLLIASGYIYHSGPVGIATATLRLKHTSTTVHTVLLDTTDSDAVVPMIRFAFSLCAIVTGLSGVTTFSVTAQASAEDNHIAYGNLVVLEF